jgi:predicted transcriptional regulator
MTDAARRAEGDRRIEIATDLTFDETAATQTFGIVARKSGGKTYLAGKLVEQLYRLKCPLVVIDPVGNWWGLTVAANGRDPGLTLVVLGGEKGDVELSPEGGAAVAELVVERNLNVVLDVSSFSKMNMRRFVADFCERLFERSKRRRQARMVVFEEAQRFAPQQFKGQERMLGAVEDIVRLGRNYGLGCMLISQRPQSVNKEVLSQVECLFVGQINESHARKALLAWIVEKDEDLKTRLDELAALRRGEFFCWSPSWLRIFQKIQVLPKWTYDASSTPGIGEDSSHVEPPVGRLSGGELDALRIAMQGPTVAKAAGKTVSKIAANSTVSKIIAQTRAEVADEEARRQEQGARRAAEAKVEGLLDDVARHEKKQAEIRKGLTEIIKEVEGLKRRLNDEIAPGLIALIRCLGLSDTREAPPTKDLPPVPAPASVDKAGPVDRGGHDALGKCSKAILTVLVQQKKPLTKPRLALMAGYSAKSSSFSNSLSELRTKGWVDGRGDLEATAAGATALGSVPRLPVGKALFDYWLNHPRLDKCSRAILTALRAAPSAAPILGKADLARATGYSVTSSSFSNSLSRLRTLGLIEGRGALALARDLR